MACGEANLQHSPGRAAGEYGSPRTPKHGSPPETFVLLPFDSLLISPEDANSLTTVNRWMAAVAKQQGRPFNDPLPMTPLQVG